MRQGFTVWQAKNGWFWHLASKKREENSVKFLAINSAVNSTKLLFPKHSRCGIVCKVAEFYLAPNLEITALWSALFKNFSPDQPPEGVYFKRCFFNLMRGDKFISNELKIQEISINDIKMYENNPSDEWEKFTGKKAEKL